MTDLLVALIVMAAFAGVVIGIPVWGVVAGRRATRIATETREAAESRRRQAEVERIRLEQRAKGSIAAWRASHRQSAYVYVTEFISGSYWGGADNPFSKVGISKHRIDRTRQHESNGHRVVRTWKVPSIAVARAVEREVLDWASFSTGFDSRRDAPFLQDEMGQGGYTEMTVVPAADLSAAVDESVRHFTADTGPAPVVTQAELQRTAA